ncbi:MAG: hypothetical protein PHT34_04200, partial [Oscillospiraceae bacterium]|nr:hypothetical protein [Oscillospiraceae bacterium]
PPDGKENRRKGWKSFLLGICRQRWRRFYNIKGMHMGFDSCRSIRILVLLEFWYFIRRLSGCWSLLRQKMNAVFHPARGAAGGGSFQSTAAILLIHAVAGTGYQAQIKDPFP